MAGYTVVMNPITHIVLRRFHHTVRTMRCTTKLNTSDIFSGSPTYLRRVRINRKTLSPSGIPITDTAASRYLRLAYLGATPTSISLRLSQSRAPQSLSQSRQIRGGRRRILPVPRVMSLVEGSCSSQAVCPSRIQHGLLVLWMLLRHTEDN